MTTATRSANKNPPASASTTSAVEPIQQDNHTDVDCQPGLEVSTSPTDTTLETQHDQLRAEMLREEARILRGDFPRNASFIEHFLHDAQPPLFEQQTVHPRTSVRTTTFDIPDDDHTASSSEPARPAPRPTTLDDIPRIAPPDSVRAGAAHHSVRGVSNSSAAFSHPCSLSLTSAHRWFGGPCAIPSPDRRKHSQNEGCQRPHTRTYSTGQT